MGPKALILNEQLLQAQRLLQQTPLGIMKIAINSGFNSTRSLQHHMQTRWSLALRLCAHTLAGRAGYLARRELIIKKHITRMDLSPDEAAPWRSYLTLALWSLPCP